MSAANCNQHSRVSEIVEIWMGGAELISVHVGKKPKQENGDSEIFRI